MGRNRVLSFMSHFSGKPRESSTSSTTLSSPAPVFVAKGDFSATTSILTHHKTIHNRSHSATLYTPPPPDYSYELETVTPPSSTPDRGSTDYDQSPVANSPTPSTATSRTRVRSALGHSRPLSIVQAYQPPLMDVTEDTIPELQPIFTFLNSHGNKLYQEGYFLKLDDQNTQGKTNPDRSWTECFAQLVGTVLSLWDAAELDAAGDSGEVLPKFINLTDASIKMIDALPTRPAEDKPLQNILSISTAGRNRYLLHFNSRHSLIQWTAGIRLAMYEHTTLQEAYTGALIAGKGKLLNNIGVIMERARTPIEMWVRVRFGAGVPWRRCWCVISAPDDKEYAKLQKERRKKSPYDRSHAPALKGDIKFYDTRREGKKQRKVKPIATIIDAYSAFALYPQAKSLIEASTLIKIEGNITIHSSPPSSTEGFVFIMPEVHPAVSGFEMMLRTLFPTWDTFGLYGRPGRLVASTLDQRSLMFAMPKHKRYGYLEILDVTALILNDGSADWTEKEWRRRLKELTGSRMNAANEAPESDSMSRGSSKHRSFGPKPPLAVGIADDGRVSRTSRSISLGQHPPARTDSAPPCGERERAATFSAVKSGLGHARNASDPSSSDPHRGLPSGPAGAGDSQTMGPGQEAAPSFVSDVASMRDRMSSDADDELSVPTQPVESMRKLATPEPVTKPPAFAHAPGDKPNITAQSTPEMRRANSRISDTTLAQLAQAGGVMGVAEQQGWVNERKDDHVHAGSGLASSASILNEQRGPAAVHTDSRDIETSANAGSAEAMNEKRRGPDASPGASRTGTPDVQNPVYRPMTGHDQGGQPDPYRRGRTPPPSVYSAAPNANGLPPLNTSPPITRKPLPARMDSLRHPPLSPAPPSPSSTGSIANGIDADALAQVHAMPNGRGTPPQDAYPYDRRQNTMESKASSIYDSSEPDYDSTRPSTETCRSVERPRAGVLRTVGEDVLPSARDDMDIPSVDFGPAFSYGHVPGSDPTTGANAAPPAKRSPVPEASRPNHSDSVDQSRRNGLSRNPLGAGHGHAAGPTVSAEQFVQQRACQAAAPMYSHSRQHSANTIKGPRSRPCTPHSRNNSQDLLQRPGSRGAGDLLQRPGSRGAGAVLGNPGTSEGKLSAREREHVARVTGSTLIQVNKSALPNGGGLVGAIEAREREKKAGFSSQAAQHAIINQREQLGYQNFQSSLPSPLPSPGMAPSSGTYSQMGRYMGPPSPGFGPGGQPSTHAGAGYQAVQSQTYAQPSSWLNPDSRPPPPGYQATAPFPRAGQQGQGRGQGRQAGPAYHSQAF